MILPDMKDRNGKWIEFINNRKTLYWTAAGCLWRNMNRRCGQKFKEEFPSYKDCQHNFKDFQDFAEWCQGQVGYGQDGFQLDKDILCKGNKIYSKETCAFVPAKINYLFEKCDRSRGEHPIGVCYLKNEKVFIAQIKIDKRTKRLGKFKTATDAFAAYKIAKETLIKSYAERFKGVIDERVYEVLMSYSVEIDD